MSPCYSIDIAKALLQIQQMRCISNRMSQYDPVILFYKLKNASFDFARNLVLVLTWSWLGLGLDTTGLGSVLVSSNAVLIAL